MKHHVVPYLFRLVCVDDRKDTVVTDTVPGANRSIELLREIRAESGEAMGTRQSFKWRKRHLRMVARVNYLNAVHYRNVRGGWIVPDTRIALCKLRRCSFLLKPLFFISLPIQ
ncbi:MAG: hypothetical protein RR775_00430 [Massilia sp.]